MFYVFNLGNNALEASKNISCIKDEEAVDLWRVTNDPRYFVNLAKLLLALVYKPIWTSDLILVV